MPVHIKGVPAGPAKVTPLPAKEPPRPSEALAVLQAMEKEKGYPLWLPGSKVPQAERLPTGIYEVDLALGGGIPRGRITILLGKEGSLKTTVALKTAGVLQHTDRLDNKVVLVDVEGTYDPRWSANFGVDTDALMVAKPSYAEEASDMVDALLHADDVGLIIIDSIGVFAGTKELEQSADDKFYGGASIPVNGMVRKIIWGFGKEAARGHRPAVVLINQPRIAVGPVPVEWMPGGKLQLSQSALTLKMTGKQVIEKAVDPLNATWHNTVVEIKKAKVGVTRKSFEFDLCLIPHDDINIGETDSWNTVMNALKGFGLLHKVTQGWHLAGATYPNLVPIQQRFRTNVPFRLEMQGLIMQKAFDNQFLVAN